MNEMVMHGLIAGALGLLFGFSLPYFSQKLAEYKWRRKNRVLEADSRFTGLTAMLLCALANGLGWGLCWYFGAATPIPAVLAALIWSLGAVLVVVDLRLRLIPNEVLAVMLLLGIPMEVMLRGLDSLIPCIFAAIVVFVIYGSLGNFMGLYKIGAGDVKLSMVMALTLGFPVLMYSMLAMALSLLAFCGVGLLLRKITLKSMLPFGPFLVPGYWVGLVVHLAIAAYL